MKLINSIKANITRLTGHKFSDEIQAEAELDQALADIKTPATNEETATQLTGLQESLTALQTKASESEPVLTAHTTQLSEITTQIAELKAQNETANATILKLTNDLSATKANVSELAQAALNKISLKQGDTDVLGHLEEPSKGRTNPNRGSHRVAEN